MFDTEHLHDGSMIVTDSDTPNVRYIVFQDTDSESPVEWEPGSSVTVYATSHRGSVDIPREELARVFERVYSKDHDANAALAVTRRYARVYRGWAPDRANDAIVTYCARGYSQSDWWDILATTHEDTYAGSLAQTWEQWARGDVYAVATEYATECDRGETHWGGTNDQGIDSMALGGIYADGAEDAVAQYLTIHFA